MRRLLVLPPILVLLLCGFLAVTEDEGRFVRIEAVRLGVDAEGQTRVVLDMDGRPSFLVGAAGSQTPEIVVHLEGGQFVMGELSEGDTRGLLTGRGDGLGLVDHYEFGPGVLRIRLAETALPVRSFVLPPKGKIDHHRLVIDLDEATQAEFAAATERYEAPALPAPVVTKPEPAKVAQAEPRPETQKRAVPLPSLKPESQPLPAIAAVDLPAATEPLRSAPKSRPLIVLDPGHGGRDSGTVGQHGTREDDLILRYARELQRTLLARGYEVILTREDDTYVDHNQRIGLARERHADLFMSLHADAHEDRSVRGASVYTLSQRRSDRMEAEIKQTGDFVLYDVEVSEDDGVGDILLDLAQSATRQNSDRLANALITSMRPVMPLLKNPKRRGALLVLLSPDVPAVLVEVAFLSNAKDEANLTSPAWRRQAVDAIANGVDRYFEEVGIEQRLAGGNANSG
jgi:N-acetylmuramoyl-L-alanine amidase